MKKLNVELMEHEIEEIIESLQHRYKQTLRFTREPLNYPPSWVKSAQDEQSTIMDLLPKLRAML